MILEYSEEDMLRYLLKMGYTVGKQLITVDVNDFERPHIVKEEIRVDALFIDDEPITLTPDFKKDIEHHFKEHIKIHISHIITC